VTCDVIKKKRAKIVVDVEGSINYKILAHFFSIIDLCRVETASIQEQKYAVYRTLPVLKGGTVFAVYLKTFQCRFLKR